MENYEQYNVTCSSCWRDQSKGRPGESKGAPCSCSCHRRGAHSPRICQLLWTSAATWRISSWVRHSNYVPCIRKRLTCISRFTFHWNRCSGKQTRLPGLCPAGLSYEESGCRLVVIGLEIEECLSAPPPRASQTRQSHVLKSSSYSSFHAAFCRQILDISPWKRDQVLTVPRWWWGPLYLIVSSLPDAVPWLVGHQYPGLCGVPVLRIVVTLPEAVKSQTRLKWRQCPITGWCYNSLASQWRSGRWNTMAALMFCRDLSWVTRHTVCTERVRHMHLPCTFPAPSLHLPYIPSDTPCTAPL